VEKKRELLRAIEWQEGPDIAGLGVIAEFRLPRGQVFTGAKGARVFLEMAQYPAPKDLLGILLPYGSSEWFVVFESKPTAQKDEGKGKPDAVALLKVLRAENEADNAARRAHGWAERTDLEWEKTPSYDDRGENLTWTTRSSFAGRRVLRSTTRVFGQHGAIDAHVVAGADDLARVETTLANLLTVLEFTDGPNGGMRRTDMAAGGDSKSSRSTSVTYVHTTNYTGRAIKTFVKSPRTIGGGITAFVGAIGAAFRKKRKTA
jgi:uncharacterized membrane-anchored protein